MRSGRVTSLALLFALAAAGAHAGETPPPVAARAWLATIRPSPALQAHLDRTVETLLAGDATLRRTDHRVAVLDLGPDGPRLAERRGTTPIYPASVVKFVYLMAAYAFRDAGNLRFDDELDRQMTAMIRVSSNQATQRVFARITGTAPGSELPPAEYATFRTRRLLVEDWLRTLGITDLHCVNPTYDGGGDMSPRDKQFLGDASVPGGLPHRAGELPNRTAMTAVGTAKLLALLATDRALSPASSADVRRRMRRDPREQRHLAARIAGGAARIPGLEVYAKSGTWGPIYADAGIVRQTATGHDVVIVVFTQGAPAYRGPFINELTYRMVDRVLAPGS
jgi:beta-lactamase class A